MLSPRRFFQKIFQKISIQVAEFVDLPQATGTIKGLHRFVSDDQGANPMNCTLRSVRISAIGLVVAVCHSAVAQLQITEIMYNPSGDDGDSWEWFEVRNMGATDVDLLDTYLDRLGDDVIPLGASPNVNANSANTIIPAGGVAVIYDGFVSNGSPLNHDPQLFRTAWGLGANVRLISADRFPTLVNSGGGSIGIWDTYADYAMDIDGKGTVDPEDDEVGSFNNALVGIEYAQSAPWPGSPATPASIEWTGNGASSDGAQWKRSSTSAVPSRGAVTSTVVVGQGVINDTDDYANPGDVFSSATGTPGSGLFITEIMHSPASDDARWEWIEVYNNTGSAIDFENTNYVLDDDDDSDLTSANITEGSIPHGGIAILYDDDLTKDQIEAAWGNGPNYIPVSNKTTLAAADLVALWPSFAAYQMETDPTPGAGSPARTHDHTIAEVSYSEGEGGFPESNGSSSIYVSSFATSGGPLVGDYNGDGLVDSADYTIWRDTRGSTTDLRANGDGSNSVIDQADYGAWKANYGESGDEGTTLTWALDIPPSGNSYGADEVEGPVTLHSGGDIGTPGSFVPIPLAGEAAAVPEPASAVLLLAGIAIAAVALHR